MKESAFQSEPRVSESLVRHTSTSPADKAKVTISDGKSADEEKPKKSSLCRTVDGCREELQDQVGSGGAQHRGQRAEPGQVVHEHTGVPKALLAAPLVGLRFVSPFSEWTHFHRVDMNSVCCQSHLIGKGCVTEEDYGGLWEGKFCLCNTLEHPLLAGVPHLKHGIPEGI